MLRRLVLNDAAPLNTERAPIVPTVQLLASSGARNPLRASRPTAVNVAAGRNPGQFEYCANGYQFVDTSLPTADPSTTGTITSSQDITNPTAPSPTQPTNEVERAPFKPSLMANRYWRAHRENSPPQEVAGRLAVHVSANYRGNYRLARNRPADIPTE
ncbi:hypothetical protein C8A01DRAFT_36421 [Parachaetomium inaequale]|uniref:Uncharacterized protein n=1 Tax=Parachaetomium inaequale TaxID=2588326 RepID=A0AAN6PEL6_9PEZI|nr:hypothetical protein C8A01DRAFT_36421 [Parachaetomium inaequale]